MRRKLTADEIKALDSGQVCYVKLWRLWQPAPHLVWEGETQLHIQRSSSNDLAVITPRGHGWAEGGASDVSADGVIVEDYWMEIFSR